MTLWENIEQWRLDGTWDRLQDACERKTPIKIKRSDGTFSTGIILEVNIRCIVAWGTAVHEVTFTGGHCLLPPGVFSKLPLVSELIEWNRWLGADDRLPTFRPSAITPVRIIAGRDLLPEAMRS